MILLVPTDFSTHSRIAVLYAADLAQVLNAQIVLVSVFNVNPSQANLLHSTKLEEEIVVGIRKDAADLLREIRKKVSSTPEIEFHTATGYPFDEAVRKLVHQFDADMIVMGSKGATGLKRVLLGSNAVAVMNTSTVPVLIIPENVMYTPPRSIVYATDMYSYREETRTIATFARLFDAEVKILHVLPKGSSRDVDADVVAAELISLTNYDKITFELLNNDDVAQAVDAYATQTNADMLAMFTHHLDFYEKLFGRSVTRRLAFHTKVPLLAFNKTTLE